MTQLTEFLKRRIVDPEITLYVWELIIIILAEIGMLFSWYFALKN